MKNIKRFYLHELIGATDFSCEVSNKLTKLLGHSSAKLEPSSKVGLRISYARAAEWIRLDSLALIIQPCASEQLKPLSRSLHIEILAEWLSSIGALRTNTCLLNVCRAPVSRSRYIAKINRPQERKRIAACMWAMNYCLGVKYSCRLVHHQQPNYIIWPWIHANTITVIARRRWLIVEWSLFTRGRVMKRLQNAWWTRLRSFSDIFEPIFRATCMRATLYRLFLKLVWLSKNLIGLDALINWVSLRSIYFCTSIHTYAWYASERSLKRSFTIHARVRHF